jgi:hypothetical protein
MQTADKYLKKNSGVALKWRGIWQDRGRGKGKGWKRIDPTVFP